MNRIQEFVAALTDSQKMEIVEDFGKFEATGVTGNTVLREQTNELMHQWGVTANVTIWMQQVAFEVHREFSMRYIRAKLDGNIA